MNKTRLDLRAHAQQLYHTAIEKAQAQQTLPPAFETFLPQLEHAIEQSAGHNWHLFGFGKAAFDMALSVLNIPDIIKPPSDTTIITDTVPSYTRSDIEVLLADHPIPTQRNIEATTQFIERLKAIPKQDPIVMLISGGGSAMLCQPRPGITLVAKQATTQALLNANCDIKAINTVRKHLSGIKGGQLAQIIKARPIFSLVISDVLGDDLSSIASGPLIGDKTSFADALQVINHCQLEKTIPKEVIEYLQAGLAGRYPDTPTPDDHCFNGIVHKIIASNHQSVDAMKAYALKLGFATQIISHNLCGEARIAAQQFIQRVHHSLATNNGVQALLAGGETTVKVTGTGKGGRNQELALAFSIEMEKKQVDCPWVFLSAGTDGRDGPTDAAGAIIDHTTLKRGYDNGRDPIIDLNNNNAYAFLHATGDLIPEIATGTNVADVQAFIAGNK